MPEGQESQSLLKPTLESNPLQEQSMQAFMGEWAQLNDGMKLNFVPRAEWHKEDPLRKDEKGQTLSMPEDMNLLEMISVVRKIDQDTFKDKPEKWEKKRASYQPFGHMFKDVGIYLAKNIEVINEGKEIAIATAQDYYTLGEGYETGEQHHALPIDVLESLDLSPAAQNYFDTVFGVKRLHSYRNRSADNAKDLDTTRHELLSQFFQTAERAKESEPHRKAIDKAVKRRIEKPLERPTQEIINTLFDRGMEKLVTEFGKDAQWENQVIEKFKDLGIDLEADKRSLRSQLEIPRLKDELTELRKNGNIKKISEKEREIGLLVQNAISKLTYEGENYSPQSLIDQKTLNCVGASMLGGAMLKEAGVTYLTVDDEGVEGTEAHSYTILITSDNKASLQDFLGPHMNEQVIPEDVQHYLVEFAHGNKEKSKILSVEPKGLLQVYRPELGHKMQVLSTFTTSFLRKNDDEATIIGAKALLQLDSQNISAYNLLGRANYGLGQYEEAVKNLSFFVEHSGLPYSALMLLGSALSKTNRYKEAIPYLERAQQERPTGPLAYKMLGAAYEELGETTKSLDFYRQYIKLLEVKQDLTEEETVQINLIKEHIAQEEVKEK